MGLSWTVLGCSGTYAGPGQACSGYLLRAAGTTVWVDAGPGTLGRLQEHVELADLDAVVLSHHHPDHWLELPVLRNALRYVVGREALPVYGTDGTLRLARELIGELEPTFRWTTISDGASFELGPVRVTCSRTDHPVETLAMRFDAGSRSLVYTSDTGSAWSAEQLGDGIDVLVCEASLAEEREDAVQHLSGRQAGAVGRRAGVARLVITHLIPGTDPDEQRRSAAASFGGPVEVAEPDARYEI